MRAGESKGCKADVSFASQHITSLGQPLPSALEPPPQGSTIGFAAAGQTQ